MPRITVSSLQNAKIIQDLHAQKILLQHPSLIDLAIDKNQIAHIEHIGPRLIIVLKSGEQITIDNFFSADQSTPHTLLVQGEHASKLQVNFDQNAQLIDYSPYEQSTLTVANDSQLLTTTPASTGPQVSAPAEADEVDEAEDRGPSFLKVGLALAAIEATYLLAFKKDKKTTSQEPPDLTPPTINSGTLSDDGKKITGVSEAKAKIYAVNQAGKNIGEAVADAEGNFNIVLTEEVINDAIVTIKAVDQAGNESKPVVFKGSKDTIPPAEANAQINDQGLIISGKAEPNSKVLIYDLDAKTLIAGPIYAAKDGSFSITLKTALKLGEKAQVLVEDTAGNQSKMVTIEVGKDTLAPEQPLIEAAKDGSSIKGIAEANSKITVLDSKGQLIGSGQTDTNGKFTLTLNPTLAEKDQAKIIVEDAAGNQSPALSFTAGQDSIAPNTPIATINSEGNTITGTAETNSKIEVYNLQGNVIGTATTDATGKFSLTLKNALVNNSQAKIYAIDQAGNKSPALDIVGSKDTIPPTKVVLKTVNDHVGDITGVIKQNENTDDARPVFEGSGEANAILTIYNHGFAIGTVTVNANGTWSFKPDTDLAFGKQEFSFTQMDAGHNTSDMSDSFFFNVLSPQTTSSLLFELLGKPSATSIDSATPQTDLNSNTLLSSTQKQTTALLNQLLTPTEMQQATTLQAMPKSSAFTAELPEYHLDLAQLLSPTTMLII